jgi:TolB-like protein
MTRILPLRNRLLILFFLFWGLLLGTLDCAVAGDPAEGSSSGEEPLVLAVLPFANLSGQKDYDWLSIGIGEVLTAKLGNFSCFRLIERMKLSEALKEIELGQTGLIDEETAAKAGKLVGAEELLSGSFQIAGQGIRINARLLHVETGSISTAVGTMGELQKIFEVQDKIAAALVKALNLPLSDEDKMLLAAKPTTSMGALKYYSQAVDTFTPAGRALDDDQRITLLQQSTQLDPQFAMAYSSLGDIYGFKKQDYKQARIYYQKVTVLQPYNPAPLIKLNRLYYFQRGMARVKWEGKRTPEIRSVTLSPAARNIQKERWKIIEERRRILRNQKHNGRKQRLAGIEHRK